MAAEEEDEELSPLGGGRGRVIRGVGVPPITRGVASSRVSHKMTKDPALEEEED